MVQATSACYDTFSTAMHDTEGGAPELVHRQCEITHTGAISELVHCPYI